MQNCSLAREAKDAHCESFALMRAYSESGAIRESLEGSHMPSSEPLYEPRAYFGSQEPMILGYLLPFSGHEEL